MRNALICAGVMLAVLLLWPLAFARPQAPAHPAKGSAVVTMAIPPSQPMLVRVAAATRPRGAPVAAGPSCFVRYEAAFNRCSGEEAEACRLMALDRWDVCETTGRWRD